MGACLAWAISRSETRGVAGATQTALAGWYGWLVRATAYYFLIPRLEYSFSENYAVYIPIGRFPYNTYTSRNLPLPIDRPSR